jgi:predicted alpha/beta-hydrolase family hydrolase
VRVDPAGASTWVLLAHGAGGTIDDPLTSGVATELRARGLGVLEATFLYRAAGRRMPDRVVVLERTMTEIATWLTTERRPKRLLLGGKSMGGRVAARIAKTLPAVSGVCLLSYPLHPPSKVTEANLRDRADTLRTIERPTFVAQGTRDPFGGPADIAELLPTATVLSIEGADHDLAVRRGHVAPETLSAVASAIADFAG